MVVDRRSAVYQIRNKVNGKIYVGSAVDLYERWTEHKADLRNNRHHSRYLQNAWNKYGPDNFVFEVLEYVRDRAFLIEIEQFWLDYYESYKRENGYNLCPKAGSPLGYRHRPESIEKMRRFQATNPARFNMKGKKHKPESIELMRIASTGRTHTEESKKKISLSRVGIYPQCFINFDRDVRGTKAGLTRKEKGIVRGDNNPKVVLDEEKVLEIIELLKTRTPRKEIASRYGISLSTLGHIRAGRTWGHLNVDTKNELKHVRANLTESDVLEILKLVKTKIKRKEIAEKYKTSVSTVKSIQSGRTWKHLPRE